MKAETKSASSMGSVLAIAIFVASLAIFYIDPLQLGTLLYKVMVLLVGTVVAGLVFINSEKGKEFRNFMIQTRIELKKVVWRTKNEIVRTTGIVIVAVFIVAIFLWLVDAFWTFIVELIMGW